MKSFFRAFFAALLAIVVVLAVVVIIIAGKSMDKPEIKDHSYLVVDIYGEITEYHKPCGVMGEIMGDKPETLHRILGNLEKACVDDRIDGVILKIASNNTAGIAMLQEMRRAVKKVRGAGKKVYGFTDSMNRGSYFLAAACDSIFSPPTAYVDFIGIALTTLHVKGTLDKLGIKPNLHRIKDYKSAAEMVTRTDMSKESRENKEWLLDDYWQMYMEALADDRGFTEEKIVSLMQHALFWAEEARDAGLVDRILYWDDLERMLMQEKDDRLRVVSQSRYADVDPEKLGLKGKEKIAVVHAFGMIGGRKSKVDPLLGVLMGHETVAEELRRARDDDDIAAVVFRIDSPGGEGLTSDLISHEVRELSREKPVVVSMVDVAASGGYMIAYRASRIVADPMTITGSIGSISMKFNMKQLYDKLGVSYDFVTKGPMALLFSSNRDFTAEERERFEQNHWNGFNIWLRDVAEYRGMSVGELEKLAHGRVWTGRQAAKNGLVDETGGLDRAIEVAKELAEIPAEEKVTVIHYPKKKGFLELVLGGGGGVAAAARWAVYSLLREDVLDTWRMLRTQSLLVADRVELE